MFVITSNCSSLIKFTAKLIDLDLVDTHACIYVHIYVTEIMRINFFNYADEIECLNSNLPPNRKFIGIFAFIQLTGKEKQTKNQF